VPLALTRAEQFDDLIEHAIDHLADRWELDRVEFIVEDVPRATAGPGDDEVEASGVPLARIVRRPGGDQIVIFRRPMELRAVDRGDLIELAHDIVVEAVARWLGLDPGTVDPSYDDEDDG
jgi:hypothetical protein